MKGCGSIFTSTGNGAVIGAIVFSVLVFIYKNVTDPQYFNDAQSGMIFLLTIPVGAVIGAVVGFVLGARKRE